MYLPYLRNRTNEVFAVLESAPITAANRLILPIFNLVDQGGFFPGRARRIAASGQPFALILNTAPHASWSAIVALLEELNSAHPHTVFPAFEISAATSAAELAWFCSQFSAWRTIFVHRTVPSFAGLDVALHSLALEPMHVSELGVVPSVRALSAPALGLSCLTDAFQRQIVNGAYPATSPFDNNVRRYVGLGFDGVSDFATVGDHFKKGGGQASHVALHLTESVGGSYVCNHFVSHSTPKSAGIRFKYLDALAQLRAHVATNPGAFLTTGVQEFMSAHSYQGLGTAKRWSIRHHLELMNSELIGAGAKTLF
ncbi:sce7725 family protein [Stenotrophomonas maltophilia]|uniref:sce7725 family protein n=1 Tax=Stenotrophomonas maltophilia TaxID=40324 RepID=UPI000AE79061|nr:sce7725 family protein [Stenotrophomonas maltophilia]MDH2065474.1 sce7725 family protein [Stenotrophomonas maltophilia]QEU33021.1 sce7725 family protein [Stenotrophomonas maltophilia]HDX0901577.1 sce7725 family protein [Stenotrophomonas maltophilia]HDX0919513.1 sce7725 family protein [Stenotrophomonas maltophilia]HEL3012522.1 sce7725 family protein [Stenotrophomonas maltophilia]